MRFRVSITEQAEQDIQQAFNWWAHHRSKVQADRWYVGATKAIAELADNLEKHGQSRESPSFPYVIRDLLLGIGRRPTHRAVFTIRGEEVVVLTVRHVARHDLSLDDIATG